jgi:hypothetical protein
VIIGIRSGFLIARLLGITGSFGIHGSITSGFTCVTGGFRSITRSFTCITCSTGSFVRVTLISRVLLSSIANCSSITGSPFCRIRSVGGI